MSKTKKFYAVVRGHKPDIYDEWYGENGAMIQVKGFSNAVYKGFKSFQEAQKWQNTFSGSFTDKQTTWPELKKTGTEPTKQTGNHVKPNVKHANQARYNGKPDVIIYTDGSAIQNPGPGGYAAVINKGKKTSEISGGFRLTTNNRMELMACIAALENIELNSHAILYSDSKYVVDAVNKGWAKRWQANNWKRNIEEPAKNSDLWQRLLDLCDKRSVHFKWVKGHADIAGNERCDELAGTAARSVDLPVDPFFEKT